MDVADFCPNCAGNWNALMALYESGWEECECETEGVRDGTEEEGEEGMVVGMEHGEG